MDKLKTALTLDQILERMRQLNGQEKRALASRVLSDQELEAFVEEMDDTLTCERDAYEGPSKLFNRLSLQ